MRPFLAATLAVIACATACGGAPIVEKQAWPRPAPEVAPAQPRPSEAAARRLDELSTRCTGGARDACLEASRLYTDGADGVPRDADKGAAPLASLCKRGDGESCHRLEKMFEADDTAPKDAAPLNVAFKAACDRGVVDGCVGLAGSYLYGLGVNEWPARSAELLERACGLGSARGCLRLAAYHLTRYGVEQPDRSKALELIDKACTKGHQPACVNLGMRFLKGAGMFVDVPRGMELLTQACRKGEAQGCVAEAIAHRDGIGVDPDEVRARRLFRTACERGQAMSCVHLAVMTRKGKGGKGSVEEAFRWMTRGCELREGYACFLAGAELHQVVKLTEQNERFLEPSPNYGRAREFYEKACMLHVPEGCEHLDYLYSYGMGVPVDVRKAARYAERACEYGATDGCSRRRPRPWSGFNVD